MFPSTEMVDRKQTLRDVQEIEELDINEECIIGLESKIGNLRNSEVISDRNESRHIEKDLGNLGILKSENGKYDHKK